MWLVIKIVTTAITKCSFQNTARVIPKGSIVTACITELSASTPLNLIYLHRADEGNRFSTTPHIQVSVL